MHIRRPSLRVPVLALALAAPAVLAFSWASADDGAPPAPAAPPAAEATAKVPLTVHMTKGSVVWFRQSMKSDQDMDMGGMQMANQMEMNQVWSQSCDSVDEKGTMAVRMTFARVWGGMTNPMFGEIKFDSDKPGDIPDNPMLAQVAEAMTALGGMEMQGRLAPDGSMTDVKLPESASRDPQMDSQMREMATQMQGMNAYPAKPVGVGDTWDFKKTIQSNGLGIVIAVTSKVTGLDADTVTVAMDGKMSIAEDTGKSDDAADPRAAAMREMMKKMKITDSAMKGTSRFSRKDGLVISSDVDQTMTMEMELPPEAAAQGMAGGMKIQQKTKVKIERTDAPPAKAEKPAEKPAETPAAPPAGEKPPAAPAGPGAGEK